MGFFSKPRPQDVALTENGITTSIAPSSELYHGKDSGVISNEQTVSSIDAETVFKAAQAGVQAVEAAAQVWTKWHLAAAYGLIWIIYFVASLEEVVIRSMTPYVTSHFSRHSLTGAVSIMANITAGLTKLPLAKILDTWGRPQGMSLMLLIWVLGYIMMANCKNVETLAAAQVFSATGAQGISYCLTVFIADTTALKSRSLMLAFATTPYIITTWVAGPVAAKILQGPGFRWGFGIFAISVPLVVLPLIALFFINQQKAKRLGLIKSRRGKFTLQTVKQYIIDVDLFGIVILAAGMALFLLPFSIYSFQEKRWQSPMIIAMLVTGGLLIMAFLIWEKFFAPVTFIPFELLFDRTVFFGGMMFVFLFFNSMVWNAYFFSLLQVVFGQGIRDAAYISNIYRTGSCFFAVIVGFLIRWTGRFKWLNLYFGMPLMMLAVGLMIEYRKANSPLSVIIVTQIMVSFAGGTAVLCGEMAMMAPSDHQHIAVILAILNLFSSVGAAAGGTVATAIWTSVFPARLDQYLPPNIDRKKIYGSLLWQLTYVKGTPARMAIERAYGDAQKLMLITSICLLAGGLISTALWRNLNLKNMKQVKGTVV